MTLDRFNDVFHDREICVCLEVIQVIRNVRKSGELRNTFQSERFIIYLRVKVGAPQSDLKHGNFKFTVVQPAKSYIKR